MTDVREPDAGMRPVSAVVWVDPPPVGRRSMFDGFLGELRSRPGVWGRLGVSYAVSSASLSTAARDIRAGRLAGARPAGSFEARSATVDGVTCLFARYVGAERHPTPSPTKGATP